MSHTSIAFALSAGLLLVSVPAAFSAENVATPNSGSTTQTNMGAGKTGSSMESGHSTGSDPATTKPTNDTGSMNNKGPVGNSHNGP